MLSQQFPKVSHHVMLGGHFWILLENWKFAQIAKWRDLKHWGSTQSGLWASWTLPKSSVTPQVCEEVRGGSAKIAVALSGHPPQSPSVLVRGPEV